eukprot:CAMPEP_0198687476 /NCGR_PEP_ID=MMETSP1468-20131203/63053_1 /TAXON_ID=1461545 /ORGANISM="Mantoniella sp, Strain CCMP1436" /LENGTH=94 /DNA_ID=CAMNT_0044435519 /DNA_START=440 /DNA_END=725 /DNA_ORIENTATION=-
MRCCLHSKVDVAPGVRRPNTGGETGGYREHLCPPAAAAAALVAASARSGFTKELEQLLIAPREAEWEAECGVAMAGEQVRDRGREARAELGIVL